ncbi:hypothetical protein DAETH_28540 [Deinococcus aetherius]|uniref:Uncharacterized protein n=1 Tax=Deinococcus aetherius TaxID=200252 RepID=A0ABM8AGG2_9DEIO|nr:hypothetical protein [Deinococcus aetherius]BDP42885.1 hypothetical protein DAETH_28540 [Deinococcus aetherius]
MSGRKRPSGAGSNSKRFAEVKKGDEVTKIPVVKDAGTFIYLSEDHSWPTLPVTTLLTDVSWIQEGSVFTLKDNRPGTRGGMGHKTKVFVVAVDMTVAIWPGKYGQIERHVLTNPVPSNDELSEMLLGIAEGDG